MEKEEKKRKFLSCNLIISLFVIIFFLCCGLTIYFFAASPTNLWPTFADFLNKDIYTSDYEIEVEESEARENLRNQISEVGDNEIILSENEVSAIARAEIKELPNLFVNIEPNKMLIYWDLNESNGEVITGVAEVVIENDQLVVKKLGTPRIYFPESLNNYLANAALSALNFGDERASTNNLIYQLLGLNIENEIKNINLEKDELKYVVNIDVDL